MRTALLILFGIILTLDIRAQKKILVLGSSTSTCFFGPSSYETCYLIRLQRYYESIGIPIVLDNRAVAGDNCYQGMPTWYTPPGGRPSPRPYNNISEGLSGNPDVVLVNFPSNGYDVFSADEVLFCLRTIKQVANSAGKPCYITTTQPRNDPESFRTPETRRKMEEIKNRVLSEFGEFAINFWDEIVDPADNSIKPQYNADGTHLNDAGHAILFARVRDRNIINASSADVTPPSVPGNIRLVGQGSTNLSLDWDNSFDNQGIARYEIFENGALRYTSQISEIGISGLQPNTTYNYTVRAVDLAGNASPNSNLFSATTFGTPAQSGGGLSYRYYEGSWNSLPDFNTLGPVKTGTSSNLDLSVRNRNDYFGMVWEGSIQIPVSGTYTFELSSDDGSKFFINSNYNNNAVPLLNNDGLHGDQNFVTASIYLNAGSYPVAASFFEGFGNESIRLFWSGPNLSRQQVPASAFGQSQQPSAGGVNYRYYEGDWNSLPNFNSISPVKSGLTGNIDLSQRNRNDYFGFVWDAYLHVPTSGYYTFELESDDGSNFFFNTFYNPFASPTLNNDGLHGTSPAAQGTFYINAGTYPVSASFFEKWGDEAMRLYWTGPNISRQVIPGSAFTPASATAAATGGSASANATSDEGITQVKKIYPNPFSDKLRLEIQAGKESVNSYLELYDTYGRLLKRQPTGTLKKGLNSIELSLPEFIGKPQGTYILKAFMNDEQAKTFKIFKGKAR